METHGVEELFDFHRLPDSGPLLLLFLLYSPLGLCLALLRLFIGAHVFLVSCALPHGFIRRFIVRIMCSVLGIYIKQNNSNLRDRKAKLYISNHITHFDHNVINILTSCNTPMLGASSGFLCWARGFLELSGVTGRAGLADALRQYCSTQDATPVLLFPEEDTTNGRTGLLKFSSWPFTVSDTIQPVALTVQRPLLAVSTAESSWVTELLWTFFVPFTVYQVRWLPPSSRQEADSPQEFANRVQQLIAKELSVASTQVTRADKLEHIKRKKHASTMPQTNANATLRSQVLLPSTEDPRLTRMSRQVKEVLPDIPLSVIMTDLVQTNSVDETITNLLENNIALSGGATAPDPSQTSSSIAAATTTRPAGPSWPAAKAFGRSPYDRHMSLQERKEALYAYARQRYIEKQGLNMDM